MCVTSMVGDFYRDYTFPSKPYFPSFPAYLPEPDKISRAEFDDLKKTVDELKELLKRAKKYDEDTDQKDCETEDKMAILRKVAKLVGVDLEI